MGNDRYIGIFDSGLGGLTVYRALKERLPNENFVYLGDTARLPYGTKSPETVTQYALQAAKLLMEKNIKMLVVACNTASALALPGLRNKLPEMPCVGVIEAGAEAASKASVSGNILVFATEGTVRSRAYEEAIKRRRENISVRSVACNLLVGLVEEGWSEGPEAETIIRRYLRQAEDFHFDTLVLGCTHFPMLAGALRKLLPESVKIVDSAKTAAIVVERCLETYGIKNVAAKREDVFMVTDAPERFRLSARKFLAEIPVGRVEMAEFNSLPAPDNSFPRLLSAG